MSGTPSVPASSDLTSREGSLEETNSQDNHQLEPEHRESQTRLSQPEMSNGDTATNYLNGHVNGLSTNVNQNYFLQSPPSNYCQNGPSANRLSSAQCSNATGTSNLLSQCQTAEGCLSTTASCQLNFCAHCSKLSPNHIALSAPSNLIGQQSSQHSHQNPGSHHDLINSGYSSSGMKNSFADGSNFQVPGRRNAQCSKHGTTGHVMNGINGDVANGGGVGQCSCDWVDLNVGGKLFKTTKMTLSKVPGSFLDCLSNNQNLISSHLDQNGAILIDREPEYWGPVLNWLRCDKLIVADSVPLEGVLEEASFCGLTPLVALLKDRIRFRDNNTLGHSHVYRILQCKEMELAQTVSTLTDGWKFEQLVNTGTNYRYGEEDQTEFLCVVSKRKQGQKSEDIMLDQQAQNWQNRQNNLGRGGTHHHYHHNHHNHNNRT